VAREHRGSIRPTTPADGASTGGDSERDFFDSYVGDTVAAASSIIVETFNCRDVRHSASNATTVDDRARFARAGTVIDGERRGRSNWNGPRVRSRQHVGNTSHETDAGP
jgi:hypothetical protein